MKRFTGFEHGMGIGGWLTNYKRFNVLPVDKRMDITIGDMEHFRTYITEKDVAYIASLGMDHIRLGFDQIVIEESPYKYREEILDIIENFILWCRKYQLNVVLNLHKAIGNYCDIPEEVQLLDNEELQERFIKLWIMMEKRFEAYPEVAFEILNELRDVEPEKWNALADKTLKAIREKNTERKVIIGSIYWNSVHYLQNLPVYEDENVIYTFHMYAPNEFTHQQGVLQTPQCYYNRKMPYPGDIERYRDFQNLVNGDPHAYEGLQRMDRSFIYNDLQPAVEFMKERPNAILWCGEFGTIRHADIKWREAYMQDVISFLKKHEIPYCVWNYLSTPNDGNRFSLVDDDERKILSEKMARIIRGELDE